LPSVSTLLGDAPQPRAAFTLWRMRIPILRALTQRNFAILWVGQTISLLGDGIFSVALAWQALQLPSGSAALGTVIVVRSVARVGVLLIGGALADRYPKRRLMLGGEVLQMVAVAAAAFIISTGELHLWHLITVAATAGVGSGIFLSSSSALVPELVTEEFFQSANSLRSSSLLMASDLFGPALGGVIVASVGTATAFAVDAATFLASIVALIFIRPRVRVREGDAATLLHDVREGFAYVMRTPWIWVSLLAVGTVGNFASFGPLPVLIPLFVQDELKAGADALGFVLAGFGIGGLLGAIVGGSRDLRLTGPLPAFLWWMSSSIALGGLAFATSAPAAAIFLGIAGFGSQVAEVIWVTLQQKLIPPRLLGRVVATDWLVSLSLQPMGIALAAPLAGWIGVSGAFIAGSVVSTAAMAAGIARRDVRAPDR
jgi:predicted MFS family arabinose efflux permease